MPGQTENQFSAFRRRSLVRAEDAEYFSLNRDFRVVPREETAPLAAAVERAQPLVAAGPPRREAPVPTETGLPHFLGPSEPLPAPVAASAGTAVMERPEGAPSTMLDDAQAAAAANQAAPAVDPEVARLARSYKRADLEQMARDLGIVSPETLGNMTSVAQAIVSVQRLQAASA